MPILTHAGIPFSFLPVTMAHLPKLSEAGLGFVHLNTQSIL